MLVVVSLVCNTEVLLRSWDHGLRTIAAIMIFTTIAKPLNP